MPSFSHRFDDQSQVIEECFIKLLECPLQRISQRLIIGFPLYRRERLTSILQFAFFTRSSLAPPAPEDPWGKDADQDEEEEEGSAVSVVSMYLKSIVLVASSRMTKDEGCNSRSPFGSERTITGFMAIPPAPSFGSKVLPHTPVAFVFDQRVDPPAVLAKIKARANGRAAPICLATEGRLKEMRDRNLLK